MALTRTSCLATDRTSRVHIAGSSILETWCESDSHCGAQYWPIVAIVAVALIIVGTIIPWMKWFTTTMTITDRRVMLRHGVIVRRGHDVMIDSLVDVSWQADVVDRMMGCGKLILTTPSDQLVLDDVPGARRVADLFADLTDGRYDGDEDLDDYQQPWNVTAR